MPIPWTKPLETWNPKQLREGLKDCTGDNDGFFPHVAANIEGEMRRRGIDPIGATLHK